MIPEWLSPPILWVQTIQKSLVDQVASGQLMSGLPHGQEGWILLHLAAFLVAPDVFLVLYSLAAPKYIALFIGVTILCSIVGGLVDYSLGYAGGKSIIGHPKYGKIMPQGLQTRFQDFFCKYGLWTLVICSFVPVPYKPLMLTTGAIRYPFPNMMLGLSVGRSLRFLLIGGLLMFFQEAFAQYFQWIVSGIALVVLLIIGVRQGVARLKNGSTEAGESRVPGPRFLFRANVSPPIGFKVTPPPHSRSSLTESTEIFSSSTFQSVPLGARKQ